MAWIGAESMEKGCNVPFITLVIFLLLYIGAGYGQWNNWRGCVCRFVSVHMQKDYEAH